MAGTDWSAPARAMGGCGPGAPQTSNSARPTLCVVVLTEVMLNRTSVTVRAGNVTGVAAPVLPN